MARGPKVLVIDDEPAIRRLLRRGLAAAGYQVHDIGPGRDALGRAAEHQFDVLILDIDPPAGGGPEVIRIVRELSSIPILALSRCSDEDMIVEALDSGADHYVQKP